jgi:hypothetical protein
MINFSEEFKRGYTDGYSFATKHGNVDGSYIKPIGSPHYCNGYYEGVIARLVR